MSAFNNSLYSYFYHKNKVSHSSKIFLQMLYIQICMWRQISIYVNYYTKVIAASNRNETDGKEKPDIIIFQT